MKFDKLPPRRARNFWLAVSFIPALLLILQIAAFFWHWWLGLFTLYVAPPTSTEKARFPLREMN